MVGEVKALFGVLMFAQWNYLYETLTKIQTLQGFN